MKIHWLDPAFSLVEKPPHTHTLSATSTSGQELDALTNFSTQIVPALKAHQPNVSSCQLFSRLDFETSGIIATSLKENANNELLEPLYKCYLVQVRGNIPIQGWFQLETLIKSANSTGTKVIAQPATKTKGEKLKRTLFLKLKTPNNPEQCWLIALISKGARHQIRAHLAYLGFSIWNDPLYGTVSDEQVMQLFSYGLYAPGRGFFACKPQTAGPLKLTLD